MKYLSYRVRQPDWGRVSIAVFVTVLKSEFAFTGEVFKCYRGSDYTYLFINRLEQYTKELVKALMFLVLKGV